LTFWSITERALAITAGARSFLHPALLVECCGRNAAAMPTELGLGGACRHCGDAKALGLVLAEFGFAKASLRLT
jgi:hypothetical protein